MKKIVARKIFEYDPTFGGKYSRYYGYNLICSQKKSPRIIRPLLVGRPAKLSIPIYCSSLKRGKETALEFGITIKPISELNEIKFSLKSLLTKAEFDKFGSNLVRKRFVEAFIKDELKEKRSEIKCRIDRIVKMLQDLSNGNYLLISHSFYTKVFEIYLKSPNLFDQPEIIRRYFNTTKKTYNFGEGFEFYLK